MQYPGGKNSGGSFQRIINQIPPHDTFIELFAGSAAIARMKRPAERTILIDSDAAVLGRLLALPPDSGELPANCELLNLDAWRGSIAKLLG